MEQPEQPKAFPLPPDIEAVRQRIEEWRRTRERRTRMPEDLWQAAVALVEEHGMWRVSRALRVRYEGLKSRKSPPEAGPGREDASGFVDLTSVLGSSRSERAATMVELSRPDGARLSLRFDGGDGVDLQSLVRAFCQPSR